MNNVLEIQNLTKRFDQFTLDGVSFSVPAGFIMGLIGPNGAGKTTVIKLVLNMLLRDAGDIRVFGRDNRESQFTQSLGVVMDQPYYLDTWTVRQVGKVVAPFYAHWDDGAFARHCAGFHLDPEKKVKDLSRGMKMKLQIAVALSHDARLLILDEPTSGLDPVARDELLELLGDFIADETRAVLFSTHITSDLEKIADYITFVREGEIVYTGTKDEFLEGYAMVKGAPDSLTPEARQYLIGCREYGTGFDALIETVHTAHMPKDVLIEPTSIDEIIVRINRGGEEE